MSLTYLFDVKGERFSTYSQALSYAVMASMVFGLSKFPIVRLADGMVIATIYQGKKSE